MPLKTLPPLTPPYKGGESFCPPMEPRGTIEDSTSPGPSLQRRGREDGDSVNFLEWVSSLRLTKSRGKGKRRSLPFVRGGKGGVEPPPMEPRGAVEDSPSPDPSLQRRGSFCPPMEPRGAIEDSTSPGPSLQRRRKFLPAHGAPGHYRRLYLPWPLLTKEGKGRW